MVGRTRYRNAPVEAGARDAEVLETAFDEAQDLVPPALGPDEVRIFAIQLKEPLLVFRKAEEPGLLCRPLDGRALGRQLLAALSRDELAFIVECFVADRIPALVAIEVKVARLFHRLPDGDAGAVVPRLGRPDERIVGDIQFRAHIA